jgi:hypothetical protein
MAEQTWIVQGTIHAGYGDGSIRDFLPGETFTASDAPAPGELERLIESGVLKTVAETLNTEQMAEKLAHMADVEAELATLKAAVAAGEGGGRAHDLLAEAEAAVAATGKSKR